MVMVVAAIGEVNAIDDQRDKSRDARSGKGQRQSGGDAGSGGGLFDVDRLRLWCFVCAQVAPRSGREMRNG